MKLSIQFYLIFLAIISASLNLEAQPQKNCQTISQKLQGKSVTATASLFSNVLSRSGSLQQESKNMLADIEEFYNLSEPPPKICPTGCAIAPIPTIEFTVVPQKFLAQYSDHEKCRHKLEATTKNPLRYQGREFPNLEEFNGWYSDFSQGKGRDGADLYLKCDGLCSPQYSAEIARTDKGYVVDTAVVCGHARDKDDNRYNLAYSIHWQCR